MKNLTLLLAVMVVAMGLTAQEKADHVLTWKWDKGLQFGTTDGAFSLKFGGRVLNDWAYFDADDALKRGVDDEFDNGLEFRSARLHVAGKLYRTLKFKVEYDMAGGDADFKDLWLCLTKVPYLGNILVGHDKEPFSLDNLTSSRFTTFMERGLSTAFSPGRNTGFQVFNHAMEKKMTWAVGFFRQTDDYGDYDGKTGDDTYERFDDYNLTGRVTYVPVCKEGGKRLVHLGLGLSYRKPEGDKISAIKVRPESHLAPQLVNTGDITDAREMILVGLEVAGVYNQLHAQAEYVMAMVDSQAGDDPNFSAWYLQGGWFVTGETRPYKLGQGIFGRVIPNKNMNMEESTWGAIELALRVSGIDLDDGNIAGGEMMNISLGCNWYLNPNTRFSLNLIHTEAEGNDNAAYDDSAEILMARFQFDF